MRADTTLPDLLIDWPDPALLIAAEGSILAQNTSAQVLGVSVQMDEDGPTLHAPGSWSWRMSHRPDGTWLAIATPGAAADQRVMATLTHELRTPLNGIIGTASLLSDTPLQPNQQNYLGHIRQSATQLLELLNNVLDFSRLSEGRLELSLAPTSLNDLLQDVVELLSPRAHEKGIDLGVAIDPRLPIVFETDSTRLRQILFNLVGNAIKFTDRGGVLISADRIGDGDQIRLSIRDTGPGIPPTAMDRLFEAFAQARAEDVRKDSGVGLGLAIVQTLAGAMGGSVTVESDGRHGSAFHVTLPLGDAQPHTPTHPAPVRVGLVGHGPITSLALFAALTRRGHYPVNLASPGDAGRVDVCLVHAGLPQAVMAEYCAVKPTIVVVRPEDRGLIPAYRARGCAGYLVRPVRPESLFEQVRAALEGRDLAEPDTVQAAGHAARVLVADDNAINAMIARRALEKSGFDVTVVTTGREAVDSVLEGDFGLVLMDLRMPVMNGYDAMAELRAAGQVRLPIIAVSAEVDPDIERRALAAGANAVAAKPLDADTLVRIARKWALKQDEAA